LPNGTIHMSSMWPKAKAPRQARPYSVGPRSRPLAAHAGRARPEHGHRALTTRGHSQSGTVVRRSSAHRQRGHGEVYGKTIYEVQPSCRYTRTAVSMKETSWPRNSCARSFSYKGRRSTWGDILTKLPVMSGTEESSHRWMVDSGIVIRGGGQRSAVQAAKTRAKGAWHHGEIICMRNWWMVAGVSG
jgi:hypothetical protein